MKLHHMYPTRVHKSPVFTSKY